MWDSMHGWMDVPVFLFLPSSSITSLIYFGMILTALEAKGELTCFMVSCNHGNLEITCDMIILLRRSRCI